MLKEKKNLLMKKGGNNMPRAKKVKQIEEELKENEIKVNEVEAEVDTDTKNEEAENIREMELEIYKKVLMQRKKL